MDASGITDWAEVRALVHESYRLIAPKQEIARRKKRRVARGKKKG
jgi:hypothetical protein